MLHFLFRRLIQAVAVMLVISVISFAIQSQIGDPTQQLLSPTVSQSEREALRDELGLNKPVAVQYWHFLKGVSHGDLGMSYFHKEPALGLILEKLPATLELVVCTILVMILVATPCGVAAAIKPKSLFSRAVMLISTLGISIPIFIIAILMVYVFSIQLQLMPSFGRGETVPVFGSWETGLLSKDGLAHLALPVFSLSVAIMPIFIRLIRAEMLEVLESDYIRFAWSKGLSPARIYFIHALKNTALPVITIGGIQTGTLIAYTIFTESIFQWPGMGFLFIEAVGHADTPLISAYLIVVGGIFVVTNTLVDLIYGLANPTVKLESHTL
ncbi:ABC transporter permease [Marinomonas mediterranea]|jgi:ABC-type dipeptide/oligopeptide/nickel transport systems, permease components|uniref:ABC-type transporter, integral membrane subunit n=1 Tax=Marinomonas mediterranea (strain ATCC 700492 / JCM 21426 / NBRC 103028 / MMB-1) TaxID=717774 RepID=F2JZX3_MARM1|nr:ABC transporter permease [Marinomonas mediterranea]ADZ92085.1 ABC-type transporter, integral membrane subunit [Marinomonas mediterranea MMB-1]WCN10047.1 ABC transporter permease subunit [Marinomonas mediterranea]WCN14097.1 ABC transporter permease subunit [Marinomonas mediterranea]WCN18153.1 ABC transporter permease subunit [Marinomonas mediterranea MMB-1]